MVLGLTGQSGSGKTTICEQLSDNNCYILNCDKLAHVVLNSPKCLDKIVEEFSVNILDADKNLNRKALSAIVFGDREKLNKLNEIAHPIIVEAIAEKIEENKLINDIIILDAPTLFESGADKLCDKIIGVVSNEENLIKRIMARDNITLEAVKRRLSNQHNIDYFKEHCDFIIQNNSGITDLKNQINDITSKCI